MNVMRFSGILVLSFLMAGLCLAQDIIPAATSGDLAKVRELVDKDPACVNVRGSDGRTPLHWAARGVHLEVLRFLVDRGADVRAADANGLTPLHITASRGHLEASRLLVEKGAPVDAKSAGGATPFSLAARRGKKDLLEFLLANGARKEDLEIRDDYGRTPLCAVSRDGGDPATIKTLIDLGADVNAADRQGWTPIELAAWRPYPAVVELLLDAGADLMINTPSGKRLLGNAANGLERLFKRMVEKGAVLDVQTEEGGTLLHAAACGSLRIVETLVARGFDVNGRDRFSWVPLHYAVEQGRRENITFLKEKGADLNARNSLGQTPYNLAVEREDTEMIEFLKSLGADASEPRFPEISGPYLGRPRPGLTPEEFAPGIISHRYRPHSTVAVSPAGDEIFWNPMIESKGGGYSYGYLMTTRIENGRWSYPKRAAFSRREFEDDHPVFSSDGKTLYFRSDRPAPDAPQGGLRVWSVRKTGDGWGEPAPCLELPSVTRTDGMFFGFSFDEQGNYYFNDGPDIVVSRRSGGKYGPAEKLGSEINFGGYRGIPYISPKGDVLIFTSERQPFVSFRKGDGSWSPAIGVAGRLGGMVAFTGPYLMLGGQKWVDARAIEALRPKESR